MDMPYLTIMAIMAVLRDPVNADSDRFVDLS